MQFYCLPVRLSNMENDKSYTNRIGIHSVIHDSNNKYFLNVKSVRIMISYFIRPNGEKILHLP